MDWERNSKGRNKKCTQSSDLAKASIYGILTINQSSEVKGVSLFPSAWQLSRKVLPYTKPCQPLTQNTCFLSVSPNLISYKGLELPISSFLSDLTYCKNISRYKKQPCLNILKFLIENCPSGLPTKLDDLAHFFFH